MEALGLSTLGSALKHTFDLLNVNRMLSGIDTYGQVSLAILIQDMKILHYILVIGNSELHVLYCKYLTYFQRLTTG